MKGCTFGYSWHHRSCGLRRQWGPSSQQITCCFRPGGPLSWLSMIKQISHHQSSPVNSKLSFSHFCSFFLSIILMVPKNTVCVWSRCCLLGACFVSILEIPGFGSVTSHCWSNSAPFGLQSHHTSLPLSIPGLATKSAHLHLVWRVLRPKFWSHWHRRKLRLLYKYFSNNLIIFFPL